MMAGVMRGGIPRQTCISIGLATTDGDDNAERQEEFAFPRTSLVDFC